MRLGAAFLVLLSISACNAGPTPPASARSAIRPAAAAALRGRVAEQIDAAPYSYLRIQMQNGAAWVAVPKSKPMLGATVSIAHPVWIDNFQSYSLGRTWGRIAFGTLEGDAPGGPGL